MSAKGIENLNEKIATETEKLKNIFAAKVEKIEQAFEQSNTEFNDRMMKFEENMQDLAENNERERS